MLTTFGILAGVLLAGLIISGTFGYFIAEHYNQPGWSGVILVGLFGAIGILIIVLTARRYERHDE